VQNDIEQNIYDDSTIKVRMDGLTIHHWFQGMAPFI
jgi:hypothetical protein